MIAGFLLLRTIIGFFRERLVIPTAVPSWIPGHSLLTASGGLDPVQIKQQRSAEEPKQNQTTIIVFCHTASSGSLWFRNLVLFFSQVNTNLLDFTSLLLVKHITIDHNCKFTFISGETAAAGGHFLSVVFILNYGKIQLPCPMTSLPSESFANIPTIYRHFQKSHYRKFLHIFPTVISYTMKTSSSSAKPIRNHLKIPPYFTPFNWTNQRQQTPIFCHGSPRFTNYRKHRWKLAKNFPTWTGEKFLFFRRRRDEQKNASSPRSHNTQHARWCSTDKPSKIWLNDERTGISRCCSTHTNNNRAEKLLTAACLMMASIRGVYTIVVQVWFSAEFWLPPSKHKCYTESKHQRI